MHASPASFRAVLAVETRKSNGVKMGLRSRGAADDRAENVRYSLAFALQSLAAEYELAARCFVRAGRMRVTARTDRCDRD
jgi:hypothetical protein